MLSRTRLSRRLRRAVADQPNSGLNISAYCRKHKLALSTFMVWRKRLHHENTEPNTITVSKEAQKSFVRIFADSHPITSIGSCELSFPDGRILRLPHDFSVESMLVLLKGCAT